MRLLLKAIRREKKKGREGRDKNETSGSKRNQVRYTMGKCGRDIKLTRYQPFS